MNLLENKNVIITGGSRGIGKAIAEKFAQNGANIAFTCIKMSEDSFALSKNLENFGVKAKVYESDASDFESAIKLAENVFNDFGSIDVLVNNAGITKDNLLLRMSEEDFNDVMKVNMNSVFNNTKAVLRQMLKQKNGSIINLSSVVGLKGNAGQSNYSSSKAAIIGFTKSVALELGSRNIRCNAIAPGFIETEMTRALQQDQINEWAESIPLKRSGKAEDVANTSLFLASDMSSYITGQVMNVCGGMLT
jgi:3-oxoacyl-[acyl-carrier protein] reductase